MSTPTVNIHGTEFDLRCPDGCRTNHENFLPEFVGDQVPHKVASYGGYDVEIITRLGDPEADDVEIVPPNSSDGWSVEEARHHLRGLSLAIAETLSLPGVREGA